MKKLKFEKYSVYIYGAGNEYNHFMQIYPLYKNIIQIKAVVTTTVMPFSSIDGFPCITLDEMKIDSFDYIIIAIDNAWSDVFHQLKVRGINNKKILRSKAFFVPNFDFEEYRKLLDSDVTIICNYCLGGFIYNDLGLECLSPTKNCFCRSDHYFQFITNLKYYLGHEILPYEEEKNSLCTDYEKEFVSYAPKGIIDNSIIWHFNHDRTASGG